MYTAIKAGSVGPTGWARTSRHKSISEKLKESKRQLKNHKIQIQILRQFELQLKKFSEFARKKGEEKIAEKLERGLLTIRGILEKKREMFKEVGEEDLKRMEQNLNLIF